MDQGVSSQRSQVSELTTIEHQDLPSSHKQVEVDWYAVYEPTLPRQLEIRQLYQLAGNSVVCCVSFSQDRDKLATGCNGLARIFEIETGRELSTLMHREIEGRQGPGHVRAVCFSPDGGSLCTGAEDGVIRVWNAIEGVLQNTLEGHAREILSLAFTTDGRILASGSVDQTVRLWDMSDTRQISAMDIDGSVASVSVSPNDHMIAIGTLEGSITIRTLPNGDLLRVIQQPRGTVNGVFSVAFSPSGRYLAWSCKDKTVNTWNVDIENAPPTSQATPSDVEGETVQRTLSGHTVRSAKIFMTTLC
jgi:glucose repression regulatory protein TUP1